MGAAQRDSIGDEERQEVRELVRWFTSQYPTVEDRMDYVRRKYREGTRRHRGFATRGDD